MWEFLIIAIFAVGYLVIIFEHYTQVNKTGVALFTAVLLWSVYLLSNPQSINESLTSLGHHVSDVAQIIFFLIGAMALVELIDSHGGFKIVTEKIRTNSIRKMLWIVAFVAFFLSAVLDNLTTAILMVSLLRKLVSERNERLLLCCVVVIAANAGGAWTPIGDVTTTMLWISGQLTSISVVKALFIPSLVSMLVPLLWYTWRYKGRLSMQKMKNAELKAAPGAGLIFTLGIAGLIFVPIFKTWTGLPPFMGVLLAFSVLWMVTDIMHRPHENRSHLKMPYILTRVDTSGVLFFLGILLSINALETAGFLRVVANALDAAIASQALIATFIGLFSAIIDNVPLVAATMGMYSLETYPVDSALWHMIAYTAGTGGSMLIIGSAAGVALMGMEKIDFITYAKKAALPALVGYLAGMGTYLLQKMAI